jgi:MFS family permease
LSSSFGARRSEWAATTLDDWRRFFDPRFRPFHRVAVLQGLMVLAGFEVLIPFALDIGCPPALTALLGVLPVAGGMAQLAVPRLLDRTDGNLRGLTVFAATLGETRGLFYCLLAVAVALGAMNNVFALVLMTVVIGVSGVATAVSTANLLAWYSAVLPEQDRRLVVPRMFVLTLAVVVALLFPLGVALDWLAELFGIGIYAVPFAVAAVCGLAEVFAIKRLPRPGRVIVPARASAAAAPETPAERQFLRISALNAVGMGLTPYMSVYAMAVLGYSAGFALTLSAVSYLAMLAAAVVGGGMLVRGSSALLLRRSFAIRAVAVALPVAALPGYAIAPLFMYAAAALASVGFSIGQLAANERMFRLVRGPTVIRQYGRMVYRNAAAMTAGQLSSGLVLAVGGPLGYPAFAVLFGASAVTRLIAYRAAAEPSTSVLDLTTPAHYPAAAAPLALPRASAGPTGG